MIRSPLLALGLVAASPLAAQTINTCDGWEVSAANLVEPWEDNSRTFSNGAVRLAVLDTVEPAAGAFHLLVLSPPFSELGDRQCRVISWEGAGFAGLIFGELTAAYDPAVGLGFDLPAIVYLAGTADFQPVGLGITLNQATGEITAAVYPVD